MQATVKNLPVGQSPIEDAIRIQNEISSEFKHFAIPMYWFGWIISVGILAYMLKIMEHSIELFRMAPAVNIFFTLLPLISIGLTSITAAIRPWK